MRSKLLFVAACGGLLALGSAPAVAGEVDKPARPCAFPTRPGTYKAGEWEYAYETRSPGSRSETRVGELKRNGKPVEGKKDQVIVTPLGRFKFFDALYTQGWLNTLTFDRPAFPEDLVNEFAFDLYRQLWENDPSVTTGGTPDVAPQKYRLAENRFFSPYSISSALALAYAGAQGDTANQMAKTLHFPQPVWPHPTYFRDLMRTINGDMKAKRSYDLTIANALWGQKGHSFLPAFLKLTQDDYGAGLREVDFASDPEEVRQIINSWVEQQTHEKIKELFQKGTLDRQTRLVLTNAIYLKAGWQSPFAKEKTKQVDFHVPTGLTSKKVPVAMMHQQSPLTYLDGGSFQMLELPCAKQEVSMLVLLPRKVHGLTELEESLSTGKLNELLPKMKTHDVDVALPKFTMTVEFKLGDVLKKMGMPDAFEAGKADFSGMDGTKNLLLSAVAHKAYVNVYEEGIEAAAATGGVISGIQARPRAEFRGDHPFVFLIRHNATGAILFMGRVVNPATDTGK